MNEILIQQRFIKLQSDSCYVSVHASVCIEFIMFKNCRIKFYKCIKLKMDAAWFACCECVFCKQCEPSSVEAQIFKHQHFLEAAFFFDESQMFITGQEVGFDPVLLCRWNVFCIVNIWMKCWHWTGVGGYILNRRADSCSFTDFWGIIHLYIVTQKSSLLLFWNLTHPVIKGFFKWSCI